MRHDDSNDVGPLTSEGLVERPVLERVIQSTPGEVRTTMADVKSALDGFGLGADDCGSVEIALAEALNNIVEHAYGQGHGPIEVKITFGGDGLKCYLRDRGVALPNGKLPRGRPMGEFTSLEDLPEGGFGWFLIRQLARDLTYRRIDDENLLSFRIATTRQGEPA